MTTQQKQPDNSPMNLVIGKLNYLIQEVKNSNLNNSQIVQVLEVIKSDLKLNKEN